MRFVPQPRHAEVDYGNRSKPIWQEVNLLSPKKSIKLRGRNPGDVPRSHSNTVAHLKTLLKRVQRVGCGATTGELFANFSTQLTVSPEPAAGGDLSSRCITPVYSVVLGRPKREGCAGKNGTEQSNTFRSGAGYGIELLVQRRRNRASGLSRSAMSSAKF